MKESVKVKNNIDKVTHEQTVGILAMWKAFWNPEPKEESEAEIIMQDEELSKEMKELLIKASKKADSIMKPTDGGYSYKKKNLKVDARRGIEESLKKNPIHVNTKTEKVIDESEKTR